MYVKLVYVVFVVVLVVMFVGCSKKSDDGVGRDVVVIVVLLVSGVCVVGVGCVVLLVCCIV